MLSLDILLLSSEVFQFLTICGPSPTGNSIPRIQWLNRVKATSAQACAKSCGTEDISSNGLKHQKCARHDFTYRHHFQYHGLVSVTLPCSMDAFCRPTARPASMRRKHVSFSTSVCMRCLIYIGYPLLCKYMDSDIHTYLYWIYTSYEIPSPWILILCATGTEISQSNCVITNKLLALVRPLSRLWKNDLKVHCP